MIKFLQSYFKSRFHCTLSASPSPVLLPRSLYIINVRRFYLTSEVNGRKTDRERERESWSEPRELHPDRGLSRARNQVECSWCSFEKASQTFPLYTPLPRPNRRKPTRVGVPNSFSCRLCFGFWSCSFWLGVQQQDSGYTLREV